MKSFFEWSEDGETTNTFQYKGNEYQVVRKRFDDNFRVDIIENGISVVADNTGNRGFAPRIKDISLDGKILHWAKNIIKRRVKHCPKCNEVKLLKRLGKYAIEETGDYSEICEQCRIDIVRKSAEKEREERLKWHEQERKIFDEKPPIIIGGFSEKRDAYKILKDLDVPAVEKDDEFEDFLWAKGILKANDGTYYPAIFLIDTSSSGELWDAQFMAENLDTLVPQEFIFPYIGKKSSDIFPYEYETLAHIEGDFHQNNWFGSVTFQDSKHHHINLIERDFEGSRVLLRPYFSIQHLFSAVHLANLSKEVEREYVGRCTDDMFLVHRTYVSNGIFSAVAFLEATINEVFSDADTNIRGVVRDLNPDAVQMLASLWRQGIPRTAGYPVIKKYQIALLLSGKQELNSGLTPYQDVDLLIKLRNSLIHYEPDWESTGADGTFLQGKNISKKISGKFALNPLTGGKNPLFPDKCLGAGCAKWAVKVSIQFADEFFWNMGLIPTYEKIREKLDKTIKEWVD